MSTDPDLHYTKEELRAMRPKVGRMNARPRVEEESDEESDSIPDTNEETETVNGVERFVPPESIVVKGSEEENEYVFFNLFLTLQV